MIMEENINVQTTKQKIIRMVQFIVLFGLSGVIAGLGSSFYDCKSGEIICNTIMVFLGTGVVIFALVASELYDL